MVFGSGVLLGNQGHYSFSQGQELEKKVSILQSAQNFNLKINDSSVLPSDNKLVIFQLHGFPTAVGQPAGQTFVRKQNRIATRSVCDSC